jgi:ABC-type microcin C transport system permease subunit YejB
LNPLNLIIFFGVLTTLIYFYFSKEHTGLLGGTARVGIWFIMIAFGAHFGYTVMGRISLLIGQVQFILIDWLKLVKPG